MMIRFLTLAKGAAAITIVGALVLLYFILFRFDLGATPPDFADLVIITGSVQSVDWTYGDTTEPKTPLKIKLHGPATEYRYFKPYADKVSEALKPGRAVKLWVDPSDREIWQVYAQVYTAEVMVSTYESRVHWGKSNAVIGRILYSFLTLICGVIFPIRFLYREFTSNRTHSDRFEKDRTTFI